MTKTRETIKREKAEAARQKKQEEAEAARQKKREEAFRAASSRRGTRAGLRSGQDEILDDEQPSAENLERQNAHDVGVQTLLSGPVVQAMDRIRTFPISIKMLLGFMVGLSGLIYLFFPNSISNLL